MGLQHAVPIKETEKGFNEHLYFASSSMQGYRPEQEDAHLNAPDVTIDPSKNFFDRDHKFAVFGVFDGHAGMWVMNENGDLLFFFQRVFKTKSFSLFFNIQFL